jgi:hypothetical protein
MIARPARYQKAIVPVARKQPRIDQACGLAVPSPIDSTSGFQTYI